MLLSLALCALELWFLISYAQRVHEDELHIEVGEVLRLVEESEDPGWFFAVNEYTGARGKYFEKSSLPSTTRQPCRRGLWLIHEIGLPGVVPTTHIKPHPIAAPQFQTF